MSETNNPNPNMILIVDFGSQLTQMIARRVREAHVYCEVVPFHDVADAVERLAPKGIILSGGSTNSAFAPELPLQVLASGVPVLGIGYGQLAMAQALGAQVQTGDPRDFLAGEVEIVAVSPLLPESWIAGSRQPVWQGKGEAILSLPDGFKIVGRSAEAPHAIIANEGRKLYGVQFHPEVVGHTPDGQALIERFVLGVAGAAPVWGMASFRQTKVAEIRKQVGQGKVICGLSGGVDSAVAAVLIHEAIGDQLTCVFVDHGLMRLGEAEQVVSLFRDHYHIPLVARDVSDRFLSGLAGVRDPEAKRKFIGKTFIDIFEEEARKLGGAEFLAQGTVYPDVIESVRLDEGGAVAVKSHHNVGGLPERMNMQLVEPLRELFKDEVRELGRELGLPDIFVGRHPFPGPGLGIRIPGEVTKEACDILRQADAIYLEEIRAAGLYDEIWQAFAVLLPVKTVGVAEGVRTYEHVCALRAVNSVDGMTADIYPFEPAFLSRVATRIVQEVKGINRVVYDYTSKPPGTIEWE